MNENSKLTVIENLLDSVTTKTKKSVAEIKSFLDNECINYSKTKKEIYKEHDIDNARKFNFFESISDLYYRENFHSDILEILLNPNTREIGRKYFMEAFIAFLGLTNNEFDSNSDFEVIREYPTGEIYWKDDNGKQRRKEGYIDLLIKNVNQAIIIENKINYAPDMDNQLVRYMKFISDPIENGGLNISKYTVVYLTLTRNKNPPKEFDKEFEKYTTELKNPKILKHVYAIAGKKDKSLENTFLPTCQELLKEEMNNTENIDIKQTCNTASVYIEQYRTLLKHLGGNEYMKSADVQILNEIYSSKKKFDAAYDLAELLSKNGKDRVNKALEEIINDKFKQVTGKHFVYDKKHDCEAFFLENKKETCYIYFCQNGDKEKRFFQIGFCSFDNKEFEGDHKEKKKQLIRTIPNSEYSSENDDDEISKHWLWCKIANDTPTFIDDAITGLKMLFNGK